MKLPLAVDTGLSPCCCQKGWSCIPLGTRSYLVKSLLVWSVVPVLWAPGLEGSDLGEKLCFCQQLGLRLNQSGRHNLCLCQGLGPHPPLKCGQPDDIKENFSWQGWHAPSRYFWQSLQNICSQSKLSKCCIQCMYSWVSWYSGNEGSLVCCGGKAEHYRHTGSDTLSQFWLKLAK